MKINDRQADILESLNLAHHNGMTSTVAEPFGMSRLALAGSGPALTGLLRRGLAQERGNIFYITENGQVALSQHPEGDQRE